MEDSNSKKEQDEQLVEMHYSASEDIFNQEESVPMDEDGNVLEEDFVGGNMEMDLDVPGAELDNAQEAIGSEDEENNYYSLSDNEDDHEEQNEDLIN